ncbi:site-specific integrase [Rhodococcus marinonascens]|uniref:site-specific integrase n=1 Tax=Rhodococcus marinonascens TaxID=38311 RepID=UPI00093388AB|nr:site-specific integrase [Rhodococcus marinonascens]
MRDDLGRDGAEERRHLTVGRVDSLARAAASHSLLVHVLAYCGLRFGEAAALQGSDVDLERQRFRIHRSVTLVDSKLVYSSTKSNKGRDVPIPGFLCELLANHLDGHPADVLAFPESRGGAMRANNVRSRWWNAAVEKSTAPEGLTPHELRHTCASLAITAGANIKTLQRMLGHSSAALTLDRYGHLLEDDLGMVGD